MNEIILIAATDMVEINSTIGHLAGLLLSVFILGYLIYSLIKPEKF